MSQAIAVNAINIMEADRLPDGEYYLVTSCADYDEFRSLPRVVEYEKRLYAKTGWSSDSYKAYYKVGRVAIAR